MSSHAFMKNVFLNCETIWVPSELRTGPVMGTSYRWEKIAEVSYANSLDLDKTTSNSASHPDPNCLKLR